MQTIVSMATASGLGAVSIIRLSGDNALKLAQKLINKTLKPRFAHFVKINFNDEFIDEAIAIYFKAPFSYTGEDVVEFQLHGSFIICNKIIEILLSLGAKMATGGEFSKRAVLNGKMSLQKALAINDLIHAKTNYATKIIAKNLEGKLDSLFKQIRHDLVTTLAYIETAIDYAEDGIPPDVLQNAKEKLSKNAQMLEKIYTLSEQKRGLIDGFKIAIIGKPNVGKSSILNALLQNDRAIVSDIAGTTRDTLEEQIMLGGFLIKIIDTAGIRKSDDKIEAKGIEKSIESIKKADIVTAVFDINTPLSNEDLNILNLLDENKKNIIVLNKTDLKANLILDDLKKMTPKNSDFISLCANDNVDELKLNLINYFKSFATDEPITTSISLINACKISNLAINDALEYLDNQMEISAFYLNQALEQLSVFTNKFERDEILDEMFSHFCLGK